MNIYELFYLNQAIDSKDIYNVPSFSELYFSESIHQIVRESLYQTGYLDNASNYTPKALDAINKIKQYKYARKYIIINSTAFGINDENNLGVMLRQYEDDYSFYHLNMSNPDRQLLSAYRSFFNEQTMPVSKISGRFINLESFERHFGLNSGEFLKIITITRGPGKITSTNEIFFIMDNRLYYYDFNSQLLITPDMVRVNAILKARLSI